MSKHFASLALCAAGAALHCTYSFADTAASAASAQTTASKSGKPNIVVIISDDHGYADLGVVGATDIKTPNLDSLARNGIRFTSGYVTCPVCSPSRAGFITGRYQTRFGHEVNPGPNESANFGLPTDQKTIANFMKEAGYATGAIGKWHLGFTPDKQPLRRGFDEYFGFLAGAHSYEPLAKEPAKTAIRRNDTVVAESRYLTFAFNDEAKKFVEKHKTEPFFLYLAYNAIHSPMQKAPGLESRFPDIKDPKRKTMATMLAALDDGVGGLLETLRSNGLEDNTLIFFFGDNGGPTGNNGSRNTPFSGFKGNTLEGGIRVPFIVQWKARLPKGKTYDNPVISLDVLPTVLAAIGQESRIDSKLDGVNLLPYLEGQTAGKPHETLFWRFNDQYAARVGDWKLVRSSGRGGQPELYNLAQDISEKNNLAAKEPEKFKSVMSAYQEWNSKNVERLWRDTREAGGDEKTTTAPARGNRRGAKRAAETQESAESE